MMSLMSTHLSYLVQHLNIKLFVHIVKGRNPCAFIMLCKCRRIFWGKVIVYECGGLKFPNRKMVIIENSLKTNINHLTYFLIYFFVDVELEMLLIDVK